MAFNRTLLPLLSVCMHIYRVREREIKYKGISIAFSFSCFLKDWVTPFQTFPSFTFSNNALWSTSPASIHNCCTLMKSVHLQLLYSPLPEAFTLSFIRFPRLGEHSKEKNTKLYLRKYETRALTSSAFDKENMMERENIWRLCFYYNHFSPYSKKWIIVEKWSVV